MQFLLLICVDESLEVDPREANVAPWLEEMGRRGVHLQGSRLEPAAEAKTVKVRGGNLLQTDGPFAETKEQIGGFDVIECADLHEAVAVAAEHPVASFGVIEVRQLWGES